MAQSLLVLQPQRPPTHAEPAQEDAQSASFSQPHVWVAKQMGPSVPLGLQFPSTRHWTHAPVMGSTCQPQESPVDGDEEHAAGLAPPRRPATKSRAAFLRIGQT